MTAPDPGHYLLVNFIFSLKTRQVSASHFFINQLNYNMPNLNLKATYKTNCFLNNGYLKQKKNLFFFFLVLFFAFLSINQF